MGATRLPRDGVSPLQGTDKGKYDHAVLGKRRKPEKAQGPGHGHAQRRKSDEGNESAETKRKYWRRRLENRDR